MDHSFSSSMLCQNAHTYINSLHNSHRNKPVCVMQVHLAALRCVLTVGFLNYITEPEACQVPSFPSTQTHIYIHLGKVYDASQSLAAPT